MSYTDFPKATNNQFSGNSGINRVSSAVNDDLRWIFRRVHQEDDYGIDGFADVVTASGHVTGQSFALQVKYGESYFSQQTEAYVTFYGQSRHLNFYHNMPNPVLIVIGKPDGPLYWQLFKLEETERTPTGWKLNIPKRNVLDGSAGGALLEIIGQPVDAAAAAAEHWEFPEMFSETSLVFYHIDPEDLSKRNSINFVSFVLRLLSSSSLARKSQGKLELFTSAYDNDAREVWEIPEMRRWIKSVEKAEIPWFFLCNTGHPNIWLRLYFAALCGGKRHGVQVINGRKNIRFEIDPEKVLNLIEKNFSRLNKICDDKGFSEDEIETISIAVINTIRFAEVESPAGVI